MAEVTRVPAVAFLGVFGENIRRMNRLASANGDMKEAMVLRLFNTWCYIFMIK